MVNGESIEKFIIIHLKLARSQTSFSFSLQQAFIDNLKSSVLFSANLFGKIKIKRNR